MWRISQCCRTAVLPIFILALPAAAQVDQQRAAMYFREAAALCDREGGRLWDVSLCGPMVFADEATHSVATNRPAPAARQPMALGFANAAFDWGGVRWAAIVWSMIPADEHARGRIMLHELYHRIQPQLGLVVRDARQRPPGYSRWPVLDGARMAGTGKGPRRHGLRTLSRGTGRVGISVYPAQVVPGRGRE